MHFATPTDENIDLIWMYYGSNFDTLVKLKQKCYGKKDKKFAYMLKTTLLLFVKF